MRQAGDEAGLALKDLRDLARGIHPAILTNRGLPAALDDLAGRASVPVDVVAAPERAPARPGRGGRLLRRLGVPGQRRQARAARLGATVVGHAARTASWS